MGNKTRSSGPASAAVDIALDKRQITAEQPESQAGSADVATVVALRPRARAAAAAKRAAPALKLTKFWDMVADYERHLRSRRRAENTVQAYHAGFREFATWCEGQGISLHIEMIERAHVERYIIDLAETRHAAPKTVRLRFATLHAFFEWLVSEEELDESPMRRMHRPQVVEKPVPVVQDDAVERLLRSCEGRGFLNRRDYAMFRLLKECGMRRGELCGMRIEDVDLVENLAVISGKTGTRALPFSRATSDAIAAYIRSRKKEAYADLPDLWLSYYGRLNPGSLNRIIERRAQAAGIARHLHPHLFRHTWAHEYKAAGGNLEDLMELGGWSSLDMVRHYGKSAAHQRAVEDYRRRMLGQHPTKR